MVNKKENLLSVLIEAGIASRRKLAAAIMVGHVTVNGEVVTNLRQPVGNDDKIIVNGKPVILKPTHYIYIIMNKPYGVLSTASDEKGRKTVIDLLPEKYRNMRVYPAGRLDIDSTGLMILTNDGELTYRITHPSFEHEKEYMVQIKDRLKPSDIIQLERGIKLEDGMTSPSEVREVKDSPPFNYSLTIHEGRNRQVRRMFAALGHPVIALKRIRLGKLFLGNLREGEVKEMPGREMKRLFREEPQK
jgi:23S rRNA pseudouridine2605 synthase